MFLKRLFNWLIGLPIAIAGVVFAVANRQWVMVSFDPFNRVHPFASIEMPLWVLFFCGVFAGIFAGWMVAWLSQGKWRKAAREAKIELVRTHQQYQREKREHESDALVPRQDSSL